MGERRDQNKKKPKKSECGAVLRLQNSCIFSIYMWLDGEDELDVLEIIGVPALFGFLGAEQSTRMSLAQGSAHFSHEQDTVQSPAWGCLYQCVWEGQAKGIPCMFWW